VQEIRENTSQVTLQKIISKLPTTLSSAQIAQALSLQPETVQEIREGAIGKVAVSAVCKVIEYL
jgi:FixJ family two-component response regulator